MDDEDRFARALAAWRAEIDSVRLPEMLSIDAALAIVNTARQRECRSRIGLACGQRRDGGTWRRWYQSSCHQ